MKTWNMSLKGLKKILEEVKDVIQTDFNMSYFTKGLLKSTPISPKIQKCIDEFDESLEKKAKSKKRKRTDDMSIIYEHERLLKVLIALVEKQIIKTFNVHAM